MEIPPTKIHIIGPSGTGKTTLAHRLSELNGSPVVQLDPIVWLPGDIRRSNDELKPILEETLPKNGWITEGIYISGVDKVYQESDQVVWLDLPLRINLTRVTTRFIKQKLTGTDYWGFISFLKLVHGTVGYSISNHTESSGKDGDINPKILEAFLSSHKQKLVRIRSMRDYKQYLSTFKR
jgi:adenylate kinase family enzyme